MPRDKTQSHEKILAAAMQEFLQKGFEGASMKDVADAVGMTSAALYRHFDDKQAMFTALVQPAADALAEWTKKHVDTSYSLLDGGDIKQITDAMWNFETQMSDVHMVLDVMYEQPDAFRLLLCCSAGTAFEGFLHDKVEEATDQMMEFLSHCIERGLRARDVKRDEMHMLVSAYFSALVQPIEHGYALSDAKRYLNTMQDFFTPGWRLILGL